MPIFKGEIKSRIVEARFALAGKISKVAKNTGDSVAKWDILASLDRKILQTELDRQLADFEKARADFEIFNQKNNEPQTDLEKYLKAEKQASLNASVKEVELAKAKLDMSDLFSPVEGIILDDSAIVAGLYVTPAGSGLKIIDTSSYYFEAEVEQKDVSNFLEPKKCEVEITGIVNKISAESKSVVADGKKFFVQIPITNTKGILLGMNGEANF